MANREEIKLKPILDEIKCQLFDYIGGKWSQIKKERGRAVKEGESLDNPRSIVFDTHMPNSSDINILKRSFL